MSGPPELIVRLPLEGRPWIAVCADTEGQAQRLNDWIETRPEIRALVEHALALSQREQRPRMDGFEQAIGEEAA